MTNSIDPPCIVYRALLSRDHMARTGIFSGSSLFGVFTGADGLYGHPLLTFLYLLSTGLIAPALLSLLREWWVDRKDQRQTQTRKYAHELEVFTAVLEGRDQAREREIKLFIRSYERMSADQQNAFIEEIAKSAAEAAVNAHQLAEALRRISEFQNDHPAARTLPAHVETQAAMTETLRELDQGPYEKL